MARGLEQLYIATSEAKRESSWKGTKKEEAFV